MALPRPESHGPRTKGNQGSPELEKTQYLNGVATKNAIATKEFSLRNWPLDSRRTRHTATQVHCPLGTTSHPASWHPMLMDFQSL